MVDLLHHIPLHLVFLQILPYTMAFSEKDTTPAYSPLEDDQSSSSARESDELLHDGYPTARPRVSSRKRRAFIALGGIVAFLAYSFTLTTATSMYWKKQRLHGANVIDSKSILHLSV